LTDGVLVVDKPAGPTSHDVVDAVRRALSTRRVGHTGTLDPFATGVLPVCVGRATRLARFLAEGEKVYRATVRLGFATTTDDLHGEPLGPPQPVALAPEALRAAALRLTGRLPQRPPAYSAKRVGGRRLYELSREGRAVSPQPAIVTIHALDILGLEPPDRVEIEVRCSAGTYVRALARDLGEALGVGGHLVALRRLRSGCFGIGQALALERLPEAAAHLVPLGELLPDYPEVRVGQEGREAVRHGRSLSRGLVVSGFPESGEARVRVRDESGALLALAVPRGFAGAGGELPVERVLHPDVVLLEAAG
jgi:tRNA pseudouridine55 synthase